MGRTDKVSVTGTMDSGLLYGNTDAGSSNSLTGTVTVLTNANNSWN